MAATEIDDPEDVFEINDFTVVTDFERFVVTIESVLQEWNIRGARNDTSASYKITKWDSKFEKLQYGPSNYLRLTYFYPHIPSSVQNSELHDRVGSSESHLNQTARDILNPSNDFNPFNNITTMYGATEYMILSPWDPIEDQIVTEDQKNMVLSAVRVAALATECELPVFLQYGHVDRQLFFGVLTTPAIITLYEGAHLRRGQKRHKHLTGILSLFKEKVSCPISLMDAEDIRCSIQFEYAHKPAPADYTVQWNRMNVRLLPFGSVDNPVRDLILLCLWMNVKEEMVNENDVYSDLQPSNAAQWSTTVSFSHAEMILTSALRRLLELARSGMSSETAATLLGIKNAPGIRAFSNLTGGSAKLNIVPSSSITNPGNVALDEPLLPLEKEESREWMDSIFKSHFDSDASRKSPGQAVRASPPISEVKKTIHGRVARDQTDEESPVFDLVDELRGVKAAPENSVTSFIANAFCHCLVEEEYAPTAFAQIWHETVVTLRHHYENNIDIPGMSSVEHPDHTSCLLHQKIEMLQCCIRARRKRHQMYDTCSNGENFYDAEEDVSMEENVQEETVEKCSEPQGRSHALRYTYLINHPDRQLFVPMTQSFAPMTEDMFDAHMNFLNSFEDSEKQAQILQDAHVGTLESDMQAFKAANPGCCFEDFVRWHSPKDCIIDEETGAVELSDRMKIEDNVWLESWNNSKPIPAIHQTRLFNDSKIAEEIFCWLEETPVRLMSELLRPVIFTNAARQLFIHSYPVQDMYSSSSAALASLLNTATKTGNLDDYLECLKEVRNLEKHIVHYNTLYEMFDTPAPDGVPSPSSETVREFVRGILYHVKESQMDSSHRLLHHGIFVNGASEGALGESIKRIFASDTGGDSFPKPNKRMYTLRWLIPRPRSQSRVVPQRLFVSIEEDDFRVCGAFSEDSYFR